MIFWKSLTAKHVSMGFVKCVENKVIGGRKCTILWHVDDIKESHVDSKVVSEVLVELETIWKSGTTNCELWQKA